MKPPKELKCPQCKYQAIIYLFENRYWVKCIHCGLETYLKLIQNYEQNNKKTSIILTNMEHNR